MLSQSLDNLLSRKEKEKKKEKEKEKENILINDSIHNSRFDYIIK